MIAVTIIMLGAISSQSSTSTPSNVNPTTTSQVTSYQTLTPSQSQTTYICTAVGSMPIEVVNATQTITISSSTTATSAQTPTSPCGAPPPIIVGP